MSVRQLPLSILPWIIAGHIPGVYSMYQWLRKSGWVRTKLVETESARYCYSVWLRHLVKMHENALPTDPQAVAELGPGRSLGVGAAALITGVESYEAFDVVQHAHTERNLAVFDDLVDLFSRREKIPGDDEFPGIEPKLASCRFPDHVLTDERLNRVLETKRLDRLRRSFAALGDGDSCVRYQAPWHDIQASREGSVDLIFSQTVLEHVDNIAFTYDVMYRLLKPGGYMSHTIDFSGHNTAIDWNGHWTYSDLVWQFIRGRRAYLLNRSPCSWHLKEIEMCGFDIVYAERRMHPSKIDKRQLAPYLQGKLQTGDLTTSDVFVQAVKLPATEADSRV